MTINMRINPIQPLKQLPYKRRKSLRERDSYATGELGFIIDVALDPCHQVFYIGGSGHFGGAFVVDGVLPEVFEFIGGFHFGTGLGGAEFGDGAVEEVYLVVEIHHVYGEPFIQVLAVRKFYRFL